MKPYDVWNAARESTLTSTQRIVLMAVAFRAGPGGCYASESTLGSDTGLGVRAVRNALRAMTCAGWLSCDSRPGTSSVYLCRTPPRHEVPDHVAPRHEVPGGRHLVPGGRHEVPGTPARGADDPIKESIPDPIPDPIRAVGHAEGSISDRIVVGTQEPDEAEPDEQVIAELLNLDDMQLPNLNGPEANMLRHHLRRGVAPSVLRRVWTNAAANSWWAEQDKLHWRSLLRGRKAQERIDAAMVEPVQRKPVLTMAAYQRSIIEMDDLPEHQLAARKK